ncbi:MAG TPA: SseB family protein [Mycobacteriales bacterium]|nr:SseB family protein [Mycobacteriales bacterium]
MSDRPIDDSAHDRGAGDPRLIEALDSGDSAAIRRAILTVRVLVPLVEIRAAGKAAEVALPRIVNASGHAALPVFSSYDALRAWRADARPVPMLGEQAVAAALSEGCAALVLDVAGPVPHSVPLRFAR